MPPTTLPGIPPSDLLAPMDLVSHASLAAVVSCAGRLGLIGGYGSADWRNHDAIED